MMGMLHLEGDQIALLAQQQREERRRWLLEQLSHVSTWSVTFQHSLGPSKLLQSIVICGALHGPRDVTLDEFYLDSA